MTTTGWRRLVVALAFGLALVYGLMVPLGEAPDEPGHYNYARIMASEQRLPKADEEHESFQPPLLYALASPLVGLGDVERLPLLANSDFALEPGGASFLLVHTAEERFPYAGWAMGWRLMRMLSATLAAVTAYACFQTAVLLSRGRPAAGALAVAGLALMPQFSLVHGAATNDSLALALGALLVLQGVRISRGPVGRAQLAALGMVWGLAVLAKVSLLAAGLGLATAVWIGRGDSALPRRVRESALDLAALCLGLALISGPWFAVNVARYGHPLAWALVADTNAVRQGPVLWLSEVTGLYRSYWLSYVGMRLPQWFYPASLIPVVLLLVASAIGLRRSASRRLRPAAAVLLIWALGFAVSWVRWAMAVMGTDQARLLYPAAAALVPLFAASAVHGMGRRVGRIAAPVLVLSMVVVNLYGLFGGILPVFDAPAPEGRDVPSGAPRAVFDGRLELLGWELVAEDTVIRPSVRLWWRAREPLPADVWLTIRLLDERGEVVAWRRGVPDGGAYAPDCWIPGDVVPGRRLVPVPQPVNTGEYSVEVGVQTLGQEKWWPIAAGDVSAGDVLNLGEITLTGSG